MKNALYLVLSLVAALLCACATGRPTGLIYTPGATAETLSTPVSLSFSSGDTGMAGSGYMVYQRPDRLRLVILSPFGTTLSEVLVNGDRITIIDPGKNCAYSGRLEDLPDTPELRGWRLVRWVMDADPPGSAIQEGTLERVNRLGLRERATFENGLLVSKTLGDGNEARYGGFTVVAGVPLATEIVMTNPAGDRFRITLKEPELNTP
ncbi:MAG TPA: outer membrane lipoprotein LolB, partial [Geobacteraceae bacterium]